MKKVLFVAHLQSHLRQFHYWYLKHLKNCGYAVFVATKVDNEAELSFLDGYFNLPFERFPFKLNNFRCVKSLKRIVEVYNFDVVHCHTPVGGVVTRFACRNTRCNVFYTAHGFHFYNGAPLANWILYFPVEWICSFFTDVLFTMNEEDYCTANKYFHHPKIVYIHGAGFEPSHYSHLERKDNSVRFCSVGELNANKNHAMVIKALVDAHLDDVEYYIAGEGPLKNDLVKLSEQLNFKGLHLLGFRKDIPQLLSGMDIFIFPSKREGLPVSLMEAMASSLPCVVTDIRGNHDLIDADGGVLTDISVSSMSEAIKYLYNNPILWNKMGKHNSVKVQNYSYRVVEKELDAFYFENNQDNENKI